MTRTRGPTNDHGTLGAKKCPKGLSEKSLSKTQGALKVELISSFSERTSIKFLVAFDSLPRRDGAFNWLKVAFPKNFVR